MGNDQLEIKLKAVLANSIDQFNRLNTSAVNFDKTITNTITKLDKLGNVTGITRTVKSLDGAQTATVKLNKNGEVLSSTVKTVNKESKNLKTTLSTLFNVNKLYLYWNLTKRLRTTLANVYSSAVDYIETQNKFNMSMGEGKADAVKFVNEVSEAVGIAKADLMDYQSTYKNILSGLGSFTDKESEKISESLVKMALDYSSLFNVSQSDSMNKFQSALVGSIRPIRSDSGYDVSDTTIGAKAQELGVERTIGQLNQMEKRILRIIVLMDQLKRTGAFGDLARTIEQPANQIKVLKAQVQELGVWLGNVFMGTIGKILPYINAFVMVLKELVKMFAVFVGYKADDSNLSDIFESVEDSAGGIAGGLGDANKNAKELKRTLMGFDVLNVINTPTDTNSSGGGAGGSTGIDPEILNALGDYDSMLENVKMKATDIRDRIMEWLGFTKQINPLTGEISWELEDGLTNFEKILEIVKAIGLSLLTWTVSSKVAGIVSLLFGTSKKAGLGIAFGITLALSGLYLLYNGVEHLLNGDVDLFTILETAFGGAASTFGIVGIMNHIKSTKTMSLPSKLKVALGIVFAITLGFQLAETMADQLAGDGSFGTFLKGVGQSALLGLAIGVITGQPLAGLATTAGAIAVSMGISIGANIKSVDWEQVGKDIDKWATDTGTKVSTWWNDNVSPWFTAERWQGIANTALTAVNTKYTEWKEDFEIVENWWEDNVAPWFTLERWEEIAETAITSLETKYNTWKEEFKPIEDWWNEHVAPWFTWERWQQIGKTALESLKNKFLNFSFPKLHFDITFDANGLGAALFQAMGYAGTPKLNFRWYAEGGLPEFGELFVAREAGPELVGKIGNSNAVVNNDQIVQAVSQGVAQAVASVLGNMKGGDTRILIDGREVAAIVEDRIERNNNIYGTA